MSSRLRSSTRASTAASESLADTMTEITKTKGDTRRTTAPKPLRGNELARLVRFAIFASISATVFLGAVFYLVINDQLRLYPSSIKPESIKGFNSRFEFALRYQTLLLGWLVFNIHSVIYVRITRKALNPLVDSTEKHAQMQKNILTNSFEQIVLSVLLQLAFVSFADPSYTLKLIPAINIVQLIGRIAFFAGYPMYRTFGIACSLYPNSALLIYNVYKLGSYMGYY